MIPEAIAASIEGGIIALGIVALVVVFALAVRRGPPSD